MNKNEIVIRLIIKSRGVLILCTPRSQTKPLEIASSSMKNIPLMGSS
jgi:hypothetical protein